MVGHHESFYRTLPLVSNRESEWVGPDLFRHTKYLRLAYACAHVLICVCMCVGEQNERERERGGKRVSPVVQLSAPIHVKSKAAKSWCHGWPLEDQTCHFSYRSVQTHTRTHTFTALYQKKKSKHPFLFSCIHVPPVSVYVHVHMCMSSKNSPSIILTNRKKEICKPVKA